MMLYISKGIIVKQRRDTVTVNHCGRLFELRGNMAKDWLAGHIEPRYLGKARLNDLVQMGLAETQPGVDFIPELYRMLLCTVIAPKKQGMPYFGLHENEKRLLRWIRNAGLRLTTAELVRINDLCLEPEDEYLGGENRQRLVEALYHADNIFDDALETAMEHSAAMPDTLGAILGLLKKQKIVLI